MFLYGSMPQAGYELRAFTCPECETVAIVYYPPGGDRVKRRWVHQLSYTSTSVQLTTYLQSAEIPILPCPYANAMRRVRSCD